MKLTFTLFVLTVGLAASFGAHADDFFYSGNTLKKWADADERVTQGGDQAVDGFHSGKYQGYIAGVSDAVDRALYCAPDDVTLGNLGAIVRKYLYANPSGWSAPANTLVVKALQQAFPCKK